MSIIHIALTGHRPNKLGGYTITTPAYQQLQRDLEQYIQFQLDSHAEVWCHSGLALGADTIWSKAILNMKQIYPDRVFFHAHIPTLSQHKAWFKKSDIHFWHTQVEVSDKQTVYDPDFEMKTDAEKKRLIGKVLNDRNIGMIDCADILLAVYNGHSRGGTKNAIDYALKKEKAIQYVDPKRYFN